MPEGVDGVGPRVRRRRSFLLRRRKKRQGPRRPQGLSAEPPLRRAQRSLDARQKRLEPGALHRLRDISKPCDDIASSSPLERLGQRATARNEEIGPGQGLGARVIFERRRAGERARPRRRPPNAPRWRRGGTKDDCAPPRRAPASPDLRRETARVPRDLRRRGSARWPPWGRRTACRLRGTSPAPRAAALRPRRGGRCRAASALRAPSLALRSAWRRAGARGAACAPD